MSEMPNDTGMFVGLSAGMGAVLILAVMLKVAK